MARRTTPGCLRVGEKARALVDERAAREGVDRSTLVRYLLACGLDGAPPMRARDKQAKPVERVRITFRLAASAFDAIAERAAKQQVPASVMTRYLVAWALTNAPRMTAENKARFAR